MKTISIPAQSAEVNALLAEARQEDILIQTADGGRFMLAVIDDFDEEVAQTRRNVRIMALLDDRIKQTNTTSLDDVKRQLGL